MRCPYCKTELPENSKFCDNCGQEITALDTGSQHSNNYWEDYQSKAAKADSDYQALVRQENDKLREKRKRILAAIICVVIVAASIISIKVFREKKMESLLNGLYLKKKMVFT